MKIVKCPVCGSEKFYVKDPDDEYETYCFECREDKIYFDPDVDENNAPQIENDSETFCDRCSWRGRLGDINN